VHLLGCRTHVPSSSFHPYPSGHSDYCSCSEAAVVAVRELLDNWACTALDTGSPLRSGLAFHSYSRKSYGLAGSNFEYQGHSAVVDIVGLWHDEQTSAADLGIAVDDKEDGNDSKGGR
jgi:hypothetical protein